MDVCLPPSVSHTLSFSLAPLKKKSQCLGQCQVAMLCQPAYAKATARSQVLKLPCSAPCVLSAKRKRKHSSILPTFLGVTVSENVTNNYNNCRCIVSMCACLTGCPQLNEWSGVWVKQHLKKLEVQFAKYVRSHGFAPIPLSLAKIVDFELQL